MTWYQTGYIIDICAIVKNLSRSKFKEWTSLIIGL